MSEQRKGKVARSHNDNTTDCRLTRGQFERLEAHEQTAVYFQTSITTRAQGEWHANHRDALARFAETLSPR